MKVGDLVVYNLDPAMPGDENPKDVAIVVAQRQGMHSAHARALFRIYYPHHDDYLNGWEDEYRVIS